MSGGIGHGTKKVENTIDGQTIQVFILKCIQTLGHFGTFMDLIIWRKRNVSFASTTKMIPKLNITAKRLIGASSPFTERHSESP